MQNNSKNIVEKIVKQKIWLIILLGLILRLIALNQSLWLDEAINVLAARNNSLSQLIFSYMIGDFHPPLYSILLWNWFRLFPATELASRFPSVILGLISIGLTFLIGQHVFSDNKQKNQLSLLASLLLATSGLHIYYSQEARMYMLATAATLLAMLATLKLIEKKTLMRKLFFMVALVFMLMSDYQPWLLLPVFFIIFPGLTAFSLLVTIPWWTMLTHQINTGLMLAKNSPAWGQLVGALNLKAALLVPVKFLVGRISVDNNLVFAALIIIPALTLALGILKSLTTKRRSLLLLKAWLIAPFLIAFLVSFKIPIFSYFRFLFVLPAWYLLFVDGANRLKKPLRKITLMILLISNIISSTLYLALPQFHRENWKQAANYIRQFPASQSLVLFPNLAQAAALKYYGSNLTIKDKISVDFKQIPNHVFLLRYVQELFDPEDEMRSIIESQNFTKIEEQGFNGVLIWHYQKEE